MQKVRFLIGIFVICGGFIVTTATLQLRNAERFIAQYADGTMLRRGSLPPTLSRCPMPRGHSHEQPIHLSTHTSVNANPIASLGMDSGSIWVKPRLLGALLLPAMTDSAQTMTAPPQTMQPGEETLRF
jgi:hypothetical protein